VIDADLQDNAFVQNLHQVRYLVLRRGNNLGFRFHRRGHRRRRDIRRRQRCDDDRFGNCRFERRRRIGARDDRPDHLNRRGARIILACLDKDSINERLRAICAGRPCSRSKSGQD
jgi:hypothetical protein